MQEQPLLEMKNIYKNFGEIEALKGVDFRVNHNEVVGLIGDNGAGKSTLMKILAGFHKADRGEIYFEGRKEKIRSPRDAQRLGIETLYQDQALVPCLEISRNIFLGREPTRFLGFLNLKEMNETAMKLLKKIGILDVSNPGREVETLSGGQRQAVAMARSLHFTAKLFTLDEPTAGLSFKEVDNVLEFIRHLKSMGSSVIFITHNLYHAFPAADRFVILSAGKVIADIRKEGTSMEDLVKVITEARE